jgi:Abnormal spindle-like microcephaly-assoc'd, ASPM-SPD-2-Hydin/Right handed beta helix region
MRLYSKPAGQLPLETYPATDRQHWQGIAMKPKYLLLYIMLSAAGFLLLASAAPANTLQVGPGKQYATPCAAIAAAAAGDTIQIDSSGNYAGDVCAWSTSNLTLIGVGSGRAVINAAGNSSQGKAIWVISGNNTTVENIEFTGATVPSMNGAGIRQEGNNLTIRNCYFHDNQDGILGGGGNSTILIEFSEFYHNGAGDGQSHNLYIGNVAKFIFRYNYSHGSVVGHLVKSRAAENYVYYNRLSDEATGSASYEIDLPNGGKSFIIGNLIEKGPLAQNTGMIAYQAEGPAPGNPAHELFVINNTMVNDLGRGTFVAVAGSVSVPAVIKNNIFQGAGSVTSQSGAVQSNNFVGNAMLVNPSTFDYHLQAGSPAIDAGADPGIGAGVTLAPTSQYVHPSCAEGRTVVGSAMDIGAYEFNGGNGVPPANAPSRCGGGSTPAPAVTLSPNSLSFPSQLVGTTSANLSVTLTNSGNAALNISSISVAGDFAQSNTCGSTVAAGASCRISVTFTPTAGGTRTGTLSVVDNASGSPHTTSLTGTAPGAPPGVSLSPPSLSFSPQLLGSAGTSQQVKLSNSGTGSLSVSGITATGDFSQTNNCGSSLAASVACSISVTFQPTAGGNRTGNLSVSDNANGSPHSVSLTGIGQDFSLSASSSSASVNAGNTASFALAVSPDGGFNRLISVTCSGAPAASTCTVTPSSVTPDGSTVASVSVSITTTARSFVIPGIRTFPPSAELRIFLFVSALAVFVVLRSRQRRRLAFGFSSAVLLVALASGCAGVASKVSPPPPGPGVGTPAGTYTLTLTGTSGSISHSPTFTLKVN